MSGFGDFEVRLDPWQAEYGGALGIALSGAPEPTTADVDLDVERPFADWSPITIGGEPSGERIIFIDGVERLDARVLVRRGAERFYGVFGSYAAGWVEVAGGCARIPSGAIGVRRLLVFGGEQRPATEVAIRSGLTYAPACVKDNTPEAPASAIHNEMQRAEGSLGVQLRGPSLVVADGLIDFHEPAPGMTLGYVKRMLSPYLPLEQGLARLAALPPRARTPIFELRKEKKRALSWYVRLGEREPGESEISGIARIECAPMPIADATGLADRALRELCRFVPSRARDPRSPQNLLPIGALERQMRRRLGDRRFIRRQIRAFLAREERHA